jgi:hypothetical protein
MINKTKWRRLRGLPKYQNESQRCESLTLDIRIQLFLINLNLFWKKLAYLVFCPLSSKASCQMQQAALQLRAFPRTRYREMETSPNCYMPVCRNGCATAPLQQLRPVFGAVFLTIKSKRQGCGCEGNAVTRYLLQRDKCGATGRMDCMPLRDERGQCRNCRVVGSPWCKH